MVELPTHGSVHICDGKLKLDAEWTPGDRGPGSLLLTVEDQRTFDTAECVIRLDPWMAGVFQLFEDANERYLVVRGGDAIVTVSLLPLERRSSISLEYKEARSHIHPWWIAAVAQGVNLVATDRRVWAIDRAGNVLWLWNCGTVEQYQWIGDMPSVHDDRVRVPLGRVNREFEIELMLHDGAPLDSIRQRGENL